MWGFISTIQKGDTTVKEETLKKRGQLKNKIKKTVLIHRLICLSIETQADVKM